MGLGLKKKGAGDREPDPAPQQGEILPPLANSPLSDTDPPPPMRPSKAFKALPPMRRAFVDHYMVRPNATQAALNAGYSADTAGSQGGRLLKNVVIAEEIERRQAVQRHRLAIDADVVTAEIAKIAMANMGHYMSAGPDGEPRLDFSDLTPDQTAALAEVTVEEFTDGRSDKREVRRVKFKLADKLQALNLLGQKLGMFKQQHEHKHQHTVLGVLLSEIDAESRALEDSNG